jgi:hypothetical protein
MRFVSFLLATVLSAGLAGAGAGLFVGNEFVLLESGPGQGLQATPAVAFGKGVYLVAWREGWHGLGGSARIHAARVDKTGKVLDPKGIEISHAKDGVQEAPRVAFGGGVFLVVWHDLRNGEDYDVLAARVSPEGNVLDPRPIEIAVAPRNQVLADVASDGRNFLVVWQGALEEMHPWKVPQIVFHKFARPVSASGAPGSAADLGRGPQPRLAWDGASYLLVFGTAGLDGMRLDAAGKPREESRQLVRPFKDSFISVTGAPDKGWLVLNNRAVPDYWGWAGPGAIRAYLVLPEGTLDPTVKPHIDADKAGNWGKLANWLDVGGRRGNTWPYGESAVAWDGKKFVAVWQRHHLEANVEFVNSDLFASRLDGWKPLDTEGVIVAASEAEEKNPALASDGAGGLLCVYEKHEKDGKVLVVGRLIGTKV